MHILLAIVALLLVLGSIFIYSSSSVFALEQHHSSHFFLRKQAMGMAFGFLCALVTSLVPLHCIHRYTPAFFCITVAITALSLVTPCAVRIHGSSRWVKLGFLVFQPSELMKVGLLLYVAYYLDKKHATQRRSIKPFVALIATLIIPSIILLSQPDFGFTVTLVSTTIITCLVASFYVRYLGLSMVALIPAVVFLIVRYPYRAKRITTFLDPWRDPQGTGFQIIQSLIAIGSGGIHGTGIGESQQKYFYLPMQHTDFIFSIIAEEIGFCGVSVLILLYILFLYCGLRLANTLHNPFSRLFVLSFTVLITVQAVINMAVVTGLAPTKGIGLPFISYGNTNLVTNLIMLGIVVAMVKSE